MYAPSALNAVGAGMLLPALPLFAAELGVAVGWIGLLVAVQGVGSALANVPAGMAVSRFGGRATMAAGLALSGLGGLVLGLASTPLQLFAAVPLFGAGGAIWITARLAYVAGVAPPPFRGRSLALIGGSTRIGLTVGPIVGGLLTASQGLASAFIAHALIAIGSFTLVSTAVGGEPPPRAPDGASRARVRIGSTLVAHGRAFATAGAVAVCLVVLRAARILVVPLFGARLGFGLDEIGYAIGIGAAVDMSLFYVAGRVMDTWGRRWTIVPCLTLLALHLALLPWCTRYAAFVAVVMLGGLGNGLGSGAVMTLGADLAPERGRGEFIGVYRLITDIGSICAPLGVGVIAQVADLGAASVVAATAGIVGVVLMVTLVPEGLRAVRASGAE